MRLRSLIHISAIVMILLAGNFSGISVQAQDNPLEAVVNAYRAYDEWETYTSQSSTHLQLALSLEVGDTRLNITDSNVIYFDAAHEIATEAVSGTYEQKQSSRISKNDDTPQTSTIDAEANLIGVDGNIYIKGEASVTTDVVNATSNVVWAELDQSSDDAFNALDLASVTDFNDFRNNEALIELIDDAESIDGPVTTTVRGIVGDVEIYRLSLDAEQGIEALNLDLEALFAPILDEGVVDGDVFFASLLENSTLELTVYLNAEGGLVGENLKLTMALALGADQLIDAPAGSFLAVEYSLEDSRLYSNVNESVEIEVPELE